MIFSMSDYSKDEVNRRRCGAWRAETRAAVAGISEEVAEGMFCHFQKRAAMNAACSELKRMKPEKRKTIWAAVFPKMVDEVELAWTSLNPETIAHRDGGSGGGGSRFRWSLDEDEADHFLFEWLRKLMIVVGPFPELDFVSALKVTGEISGGRMEDCAGGYPLSSGHAYDPDALGYLACAVLDTAEEHPDLAKAVEDVLSSQLSGELPVQSFRHVITAIGCADRPDLWALIHQPLAEAGLEAGFRGRLLRERFGLRQGAFRSFLQTICENKLLRFSDVMDTAGSCLGIRWEWQGKKRDEMQKMLEKFLKLLGSDEEREKELAGGDAVGFALALMAEGMGDGERMLKRMKSPSGMTWQRRLAAAHVLGLCDVQRHGKAVVDYATDADLRVAAAAGDLMDVGASKLPTMAEVPDLAERLADFLDALPEKIVIPDVPPPFPKRKLNTDALFWVVANRFRDGEEARIEAMLPRMNTYARDQVVSRLNRFSQDEFDKEIAEIIYTRDPEGLAEWITDRKGEQLLAQRQLLLKMIGDRSQEIAEHARKAAKNFSISHAEFELLRPILSSKSAPKRLLLTSLLVTQPERLLAGLVPELLASSKVSERLAALEVLRAWGEDEAREKEAAKIWAAVKGYEPRAADEKRAVGILQTSLKSVKNDHEPLPSLENAFGLVDMRAYERRENAKPRDVIVRTPSALRICQALDDWLTERADREIANPNRWNDRLPETIFFHEFNFPPPYESLGREKNLAQFPQVVELLDWWRGRGDEFRDQDGLEMLRAKVLSLEAERAPVMAQKIFYGGDALHFKNPRRKLQRLVEWLAYDQGEPDGAAQFWVDVSEDVSAKLTKDMVNWAHLIHQIAIDRVIRKYDGCKREAQQLWRWVKPSPGAEREFGYFLWGVLQMMEAGVATDAELFWHLLGGKDLRGNTKDRVFGDLAKFTEARPRRETLKTARIQELVGVVRDRVLELELSRGETEEPWSVAAASISHVPGTDWLVKFVEALGKEKFKRGNGHTKSYARPAVLNHLIGVSFPGAEDTAEAFTEKVTRAKIPKDRLLELAMFSPAWVGHIEVATGVKGLRDAVSWIFTHTRSNDYQWESNMKELWAGELNLKTPIPAEEFLAGAVDVDWFREAYAAVGDTVWKELYDAAKFASTGRGHVRARLFADAILGEVKVPELEGQLIEKGNLDAALAIGLPPLAGQGKAREKDLLLRYEILQELKKRAKKSKAQRRASEENAYLIGVQNLARAAGYTDTLRFEWAMENLAAKDLAVGALRAHVDDVILEIAITVAGTLELRATREGLVLKSIPAKHRKNAAFKELKDRMAELKGQAQRLRPALEDLMVRSVAMSSAEWQGIVRHPLAGPLLSRLVLADESGLLGYPDKEGLARLNGRLSWPPDSAELHLAHPVEFGSAEDWSKWQRDVFGRKLVQPFKQVFRELYLPTEKERDQKMVIRYQKQQVRTSQAFALLAGRAWVYHSSEGLGRVFREEGVTATIWFEEYFHHSGEYENVTTDYVSFQKDGKVLANKDVPPRIFSEVMRNVDLIVSVAHATGADPEVSVSSVQARATLVSETCRMLGIENVVVEGRFAAIKGALANYRVHLGSGVVHRMPGRAIPIAREAEPERGRLFLPFVDEDPVSADVLSRVILFANDSAIKDPAIAAAIRE